VRRVSDHDNKNGFQQTTSLPAHSRTPSPLAARADPVTPAGEFKGLTAFPTSPIQKTELEPRRSSIAEVVGGAIAGAFIGLTQCVTHRYYDHVLGGLVVGAALGVFAGLWVGFLFGRAGFVSWWTVTANVFRVPFMTVATLIYPVLWIVWSRQEQQNDR
jgi:hypothetical protein